MHTRVNGQITETTTYTYDLNNRLLTKTDPTGYVLTYAYDAVGNRTNLAVTRAFQPVLTQSYSYDTRNRVTSIGAKDRVTTFQYDALGRRTNAVWPNETTATYTYDAANQLLALIHEGGAGSPNTPLASFIYSYDLGGNRTNMITLEGTNSYGYDNRNWLTYAEYPDSHVQEFQYDPVGNRTNLGGSGSTPTDYVYGPANRLLSSTSATETNEYTYDGTGRLTNQIVSGQARHYAYNFRGQMTELVDMDGRVFSYAFDGDGNRISQSLNDCLTTRFVYDGPNVVLDLNASNEVVHTYVNGLGIDEPIERIAFISGTPRTRLVHHTDALGSVVSMTDDVGTPAKTYAYEAFGKIREESGDLVINRVTYTAREALGDSRGFYFYRNRVMDPNTGRFSSDDPVAFVDGPNLEIYSVNNPVLFMDPDGATAVRSPSPTKGIGLIKTLFGACRKWEKARQRAKESCQKELDNLCKHSDPIRGSFEFMSHHGGGSDGPAMINCVYGKMKTELGEDKFKALALKCGAALGSLYPTPL